VLIPGAWLFPVQGVVALSPWLRWPIALQTHTQTHTVRFSMLPDPIPTARHACCLTGSLRRGSLSRQAYGIEYRNREYLFGYWVFTDKLRSEASLFLPGGHADAHNWANSKCEEGGGVAYHSACSRVSSQTTGFIFSRRRSVDRSVGPAASPGSWRGRWRRSWWSWRWRSCPSGRRPSAESSTRACTRSSVVGAMFCGGRGWKHESARVRIEMG